ncbi:MAG: hypothetical protein JSW58_09410 [Candidatus Latescibacterota bacterium]|nr:MAG: hypothetical protein JSW58_09410 [Candidatus Latescibacterota bacterium]
MSRLRHTLKSIALLACLTLLLAALGCTDSVMAPVEEEDVNTELGFNGISSAPEEDPGLMAGKKGSMVSAERGGRVSNGRVTLEFPPGALDEDTFITMEMVDKSNLVVEFGPHGIDFNRPVAMSMKLKDTPAEDYENAVIKWFNPATNEWEEIENLPPERPKEAKALIRHFSKYAAVGG